MARMWSRDDQVVVIVGAGATRADAARNLPDHRKPPLDRMFFGEATRTYPEMVARIRYYLLENYGRDLDRPENDSLEDVIAVLYADSYDPALMPIAFPLFQDLIRLYNRHLAHTTNGIRIRQAGCLRGILARLLLADVPPENITVVTFNQDIQIEKALASLASKKRYSRVGTILEFPGCYRFDERPVVTGPDGGPLFRRGSASHEGVAVLKLHGSLNWYSRHASPDLSQVRLFDPGRKLLVTRRMEIYPDMGFSQEGRGRTRWNTFPIVVPPVAAKARIMHDRVKPLWSLAGQSLREATSVIIFGYSCPAMDFESANLIGRSLQSSTRCRRLTIIDIEPRTVARYYHLTGCKEFAYFASAKAALTSMTPQ